MNLFFYWFLVFFIYATIGWMLEMISTFIYTKKVTNRGFLIGPYCPIYGTAALLMIIFLGKYEHDLPVLFGMSFLLSSILEYITSYLMEKIFKARWWDYSDRTFNINGRICLKNCFFFGILGILLIAYVHPFIRASLFYLLDIVPNYFYIIGFFCLFLFTIDLITSFKITIGLKKNLQNLRKDCTDEISKKVQETIATGSKSVQRLFKAFPNMKPLKLNKKKKHHFF